MRTYSESDHMYNEEMDSHNEYYLSFLKRGEEYLVILQSSLSFIMIHKALKICLRRIFRAFRIYDDIGIKKGTLMALNW